MTATSDNRWPEVTNQRAREILKHASRLPGCNRNPRFFSELEQDYELRKMHNIGDTWSTLWDSGLADRLLHSPADLPDPTTGLYGFSLWITRLFQPRDLKYLLQDMALNLRWYISPTDHRRWFFFPDHHILISLCILLYVAGLLLGGAFFTNKFAYYFFAGVIGGMSLVIPLAIVNDLNYKYGIMTYSTKSSLLYHYLLREFSEPVEDSSA